MQQLANNWHPRSHPATRISQSRTRQRLSRTLMLEPQKLPLEAGRAVSVSPSLESCIVLNLIHLAPGEPPLCWDHFDIVVNCTDQDIPENNHEKYRGRYLHLKIPSGKKGQHILFEYIPTAIDFCKEPILSGKSVLVHCTEGMYRHCKWGQPSITIC